MSTLLEQASLVMIPSGYKEDVVYSQIPTDGSGDLSFTRASNGTRINSAGLVEVVPWNLLEYSEDFSNAYWSKQNGTTITTNSTTAPNGTTTADTLEKTGGSGGLGFYYIVTSTNTFAQLTNFFYVKHKSGSGIVWLLGINSGTFAYYDIVNGTTLSKSSGMTTSIESVGNGWYKCIFSQDYGGASTTTFGIGVCLADGTPNYDATSAATQSVYIWGAQSNIGSTAKPYFPTTDRLNVPRLTYQNGGGGCPSLLLEKQSTNFQTYSEDFTQWIASSATVTANNTTSPDGTQNADRVQFTGAGYLLGTSQGSGNVYTLSCWAKRNGSGTQSVGFFKDGSGVVDSAWALTSDWQRFTYTYTASNGSYSGIAGVNGVDVFVWGAQFEQSSYPTSYIPTTSSSATRVADACFKTGISSLIGQTSGTIFWDINFVADGSEQTITINDGTNFIYLQKYIDNKIYTGVYNGSFVGSITSSVLTSGRKKIAFGYILNSLILYINGVSIGTDLTSTIPTCDRLSLTVSNTGSIETNNFILFPTKLTNSELASLTTL